MGRKRLTAEQIIHKLRPTLGRATETKPLRNCGTWRNSEKAWGYKRAMRMRELREEWIAAGRPGLVEANGG